MPNYFIDPKGLKPKEIAPGTEIRVAYGDKIMLSFVEIRPGSVVPANPLARSVERRTATRNTTLITAITSPCVCSGRAAIRSTRTSRVRVIYGSHRTEREWQRAPG